LGVREGWSLQGALARTIAALTRGATSAGMVGLVMTSCASPPSSAAKAPALFVGQDLRGYYPNLARYRTQYLEGDSYRPDPSHLSVLWFERQDQQTFLVYNSPPDSPQARCRYDELSWWEDGYLRYIQTADACGPRRTEIVYDAPIIFLPRRWDGQPWHLDGQSGARYYVDGTLRCVGTNRWTAEILGVEQVAQADSDLHWRTTQTTTWSTGDVSGGCYTGTVTHWQEDYWLTGRLLDPSGARHGKGVQRTMGGNLDEHDQTWDIRMARWVPLPGR